MNEDDRLAGAMILVVEIDVAGVFLSDSNEWHWESPSVCVAVNSLLRVVTFVVRLGCWLTRYPDLVLKEFK
jgi:hypothetical protein